MALTPQYQFSGHETFPFRYPWLKKGFDAVLTDPSAFQRDDAITELGVGKNMVRAIRHWCLAAGVLEEGERDGLRPTSFGRALLADDGLDPYLEDPSTLWLLHWHFATNRYRCATWYWVFSHFHEPEFTREALLAALTRWAQELPGKRVAESSLKRDVDVFLRTYAPARVGRGNTAEDTLDCPLVDLGLIAQPAGGATFHFRRGQQLAVPDGVLLYATLAFWEAHAPQVGTLSVADLARRPAAPGRVFKLDESALIERFEGIEQRTAGALSYGETAGLRQLYRREPLAARDALASIFAPGGKP